MLSGVFFFMRVICKKTIHAIFSNQMGEKSSPWIKIWVQRKTISPHFFPFYKIKQDFPLLNPFQFLGTETLSESIFLILGIVSQVRVSWDAAHQNIREFIPYCKYDWNVQNAFWAIKDVSKLNYSLGRQTWGEGDQFGSSSHLDF